MGEGNFNEVLGVSFDVGGFQSSLDSMIGSYTSFIQDMNTLGAGLKTPFSSSGSDSNLAALFTSLTTQVDGLQTAFNALAGTMVDGFSKAGDAASSMSRKAALDPAQIAQNNALLDQIATKYAETESTITQMAAGQVELREQYKQQEAAKAIAAAREVAEAAGISDEQQLASLEKATLQRLALINKQEEAQVKAAVSSERAQQAAADSQQAIQEKRDVEQATATGRMFAGETAAAEEANTLQIRMLQEYLDEQNNVYRASAAASTRYYEGVERDAEQANSAQIRLLNEYLDKQNSAFRQTAASQERYATEQTRNGGVYGETPAPKPSPEESGGLSGFVGSIPQTIAGLVKFQVAMAAINATIEAGLTPAKLFFATIKGGFAYDESLQNRTQDLTAALLQSVTYSSNFSDNIKLAGVDAGILVTQIDDLAVKLRIGSDTLKTGFQSFLENGGRNLTRNNSEALNASALITSAIQTQTKNPALLNRELAQEMQKLIQGTVTSSDKLVTTLGISADKLKEIVAHAKEYHDLNDEIIANSPGLVERLKEAGDNQASLVATLELYKARWEGLIAGPLFDQFTVILKQILDYLDQHKAQLSAMAVQLGDMIAQATKFVGVFINQNWDGLVTIFKTIAKIVESIGFDLAKDMADVAEIAELASSVKNTVTQAHNKASIGEANDQREFQVKKSFGYDTADSDNEDVDRQRRASNPAYKQQIEAAENTGRTNLAAVDSPSITSIGDKYQKIFSQLDAGQKAAATSVDEFGTNLPKLNAPVAPPSAPSHGINAKPDNNVAKQAEADYKEQLETLRKDTETFIAADKQLFATHQEDLQTYTTRTVQQLTIEKNAIIAAADARAKKVEGSGAKNSSVSASKIRTAGASAGDAVQKQIGELELKNTEDIEKAKQVAIKNTSDLQVQLAKNELDVMKQNGASAVDIAQKTAEIHQQEYKATLDELNAEKAINISKTQQTELAGKIADLEAKNTGQQSADKYAIQLAALKDINGLLDEQISKNASQESHARAIYDLQEKSSRDQNNAYDKQQDKISLDQKELELAQSTLLLEEQKLKVITASNGGPVTGQDKEFYSQQSKVQSAKDTVSKATEQLNNDDPNVLKIVFDDNDVKKLQDVFTQGFSTGVTDLTNAFNTFKNIIDEYNKGEKQGGLLGGIGGVLSGQGGQLLTSGANALNNTAASGTGAFSSLLSAAGPFISAIGPAFSLIGSLFTAAAKRTAEEMQKQFQQIQENYSNGSLNLQQAIQQEQSTITETISKLSGEKGGQGELDSILPGMQSSLDALQQQQKQTFVQMDQSVASLKLQQTYLQSALSNWNQINEQVTAYVNAGGSIAEAADFISQSLQAQKQQAADDLMAAESSAVQDAQNYNNLLQQRTDLIKQYNEQAFGVQNADSLERKQSNAVTAAGQLSDLTSQYQTQLQSDNEQITQLGARVTAEQQIFGIATDTASLQQESNSLALQSLQEQVTQWQSIQQIYNGIVQTSSGQYTYTAALAALLGFTAGFGNDPSSSYTGVTTPITGYTGPGTGTSAPVGVGYSAGGTGATVTPTSLSGITPINGTLPVTIVPSSTGSGITLSDLNPPTSIGVGSGSIAGNVATSSMMPVSNLTTGNISITIVNSSGATIDATSIANDLSTAIINRNQYAGSSYYS